MTKIADARGLAVGAPFDGADAGAGVGVLVLIQFSPVFASIVASLSSNFLSKESATGSSDRLSQVAGNSIAIAFRRVSPSQDG